MRSEVSRHAQCSPVATCVHFCVKESLPLCSSVLLICVSESMWKRPHLILFLKRNPPSIHVRTHARAHAHTKYGCLARHSRDTCMLFLSHTHTLRLSHKTLVICFLSLTHTHTLRLSHKTLMICFLSHTHTARTVLSPSVAVGTRRHALWASTPEARWRPQAEVRGHHAHVM